MIFFSLENRAVYEIMWKNIAETERPQMTKYDACALHDGYLRLQTHTQIISFSLVSHGNSGYANAPQCYVLRTFPVLLVHFSFFPYVLSAPFGHRKFIKTTSCDSSFFYLFCLLLGCD